MNPPFRVSWSKRSQRDLKKLDPPTLQRIFDAVTAYASTGHGDIKKLKGSKQFRLRVGDWRVIFDLDDEANLAQIDRVSHRSSAYE